MVFYCYICPHACGKGSCEAMALEGLFKTDDCIGHPHVGAVRGQHELLCISTMVNMVNPCKPYMIIPSLYLWIYTYLELLNVNLPHIVGSWDGLFSGLPHDHVHSSMVLLYAKTIAEVFKDMSRTLKFN